MEPPSSITREELYKTVWRLPAIKLKSTLDLSVPAITRLCKKLNVPQPTRGYWAKIRHGHKIPWTPLPQRGGYPKEITIRRPLPGWSSRAAHKKLSRQPTRHASPTAFALPADLKSAPHAVTKTYQALKKAQVESWGSGRFNRVTPQEHGCLDVCIGKDSIDCAMRIMTAIIRGLETLGHSVAITDLAQTYGRSRSITYAIIDDEKVQFHLEEESKQQPPLQLENGQSLEDAPKEYVPTGKLKLIIDDHGDDLRTKWTLRKDRSICDILASVADGLIAMAQVIKARRMHLQRKQAQWVADQQQATQEAQRVQALKSNTAAWEEVGRYRRFLEALESAAVRRTGGMLDSQSQVGRWLAWAKQYVDSADPVLRLVKLDGGSSGSK